MKNLFVLISLSFALLLTSCEDVFDCTKGDGPIVSRTLSLDDFNSLEISGSHKVYLSQGTTQDVRVEGHENIINLLNKRISNGHWNIKFTECTRRNDDLTFYISMPAINALAVSGSGDIVGEDVLVVENLELKIGGSGAIKAELDATNLKSEIAGSGDIVLSGKSASVNLKIAGSGKFRSYDLITDDCGVKIEGSGDAFIHVINNLNVDISGSGTVNYLGSPQVISSINGSGKVVKVN